MIRDALSLALYRTVMFLAAGAGQRELFEEMSACAENARIRMQARKKNGKAAA